MSMLSKTLNYIFIILVCVSISAISLYADRNLGLLIEESDGSPSGYAYKLKFPNGSYSLSGGVGTFSIPAGGGDVSKVGTPAQYEWGEWTGDGTLKGTAVTGSKVVCTDANGSPTACTNLTDLAFSSYATIESINTAAELESVANLGAYASDILGATDSDALVTLLDLEAGDIPDLSGTYEPIDATIIRQADVDDTPDNGDTTTPPSANWAYGHENGADPHSVYMLESALVTEVGDPGADSSYPTEQAVREGLDEKMADQVDDTTPEWGGNQDTNNKYIQMTAAPSNETPGGGADVRSVTVDQAPGAIGDCMTIASDFHYEMANANSTETTLCTALALETGTGTKLVLFRGEMRHDGWNWSAGAIYLDETDGDLTQTAPSDTGDMTQIVGHALSADTMYFNPSLWYTIHD